MVASLSTGVVSTPTLFGLDPAEIVDKADTKALARLKETKEKESQREAEAVQVEKAVFKKIPGTVTFIDYDSVHDLIADSTNDQYIRKISEFAWVGVGDGIFVLTTNSGNYLTIKPPAEETSSFMAVYYRKLPPDAKIKYAVPKKIAEAETFEHIVHAADTFAADVFQHMWIAKNQPWRRARASDAQVKFLNSFRPKEDQLSPEDLTKGKAGDMITRLKHGARGRFDKAKAKKKTIDRKQNRDDTARKRMTSQVEVGPLSAEHFAG
jgi:ATP-dependent helicase IRC3